MQSVLTVLLLIPTFFAQKQSCTNKKIQVVDSWSLPLTAVADHQNCTYKFEFSSDHYALMTIQAFDLALTSEGRDSIIVEQSAFDAASAADKSSTFYSTEAYGDHFGIWIRTLPNGTNMKLQVDIQLYKNAYGQNVVETITVGQNLPASVRYFSDLIVGGTYQLSGSSSVFLSTAYITANYNDSYSLGNVFVYSNGVLKASLYDCFVAQGNPGGGTYLGKNASLYVARAIPLSKGAIVINDLDNLDHVYQAFTVYVPINQPMATSYFYLYADYKPVRQRDGALTIIGDKDGSTSFDVREFTVTQDLGGAYFSSASGAPMSNHQQNATKINPLQVPMHFTGNLNTIYIFNGSGRVKVTVQ